jgi:23S rRNA pseudouridine1911/1915/1917 synthase
VARVKVLFEDNHLLVVDKPYGVPSQADESGDVDMLNLAKAYVKEKYNKPGEAWLGLVHRLDRPTSGVMVFARTSKAAARLSEQIREGQFEKTYLAVLTAAPEPRQGELWHWLIKDEKTHTARIVGEGDAGAKKAGLGYETLSVRDGLALVRVRLLTGRFHQIRVQFAALGCGVYGDMKYGRRDVKVPLALHACRVCLVHPTTKIRMCFDSKPLRSPFDQFDIPEV